MIWWLTKLSAIVPLATALLATALLALTSIAVAPEDPGFGAGDR